MAGNPKRRAVIAELARRAREWSGDGLELQEPATILDYVEDWTASGNTLLGMAAEMTVRLGFDVSRHTVNAALESLFGSESKTRLSAARTHASHGLAEQVIAIAEQPVADSADASRARNRMSARQWLAERYNPGEYGAKVAPAVSISLGTLHLEALQARAAVRATVAPNTEGSPLSLTESVSTTPQVLTPEELS